VTKASFSTSQHPKVVVVVFLPQKKTTPNSGTAGVKMFKRPGSPGRNQHFFITSSWFFTNPFEKYARQIWKSSPSFGVKTKNI